MDGQWRGVDRWEDDGVPPDRVVVDFKDGSGPIQCFGSPEAKKVDSELIWVDPGFIAGLVAASESSAQDVPSDCRVAIKWTAATSSLAPSLDWGIPERDENGNWCSILSTRDGPTRVEAASGELRPREWTGGAKLFTDPSDRKGTSAGPGQFWIGRSGILEFGVDDPASTASILVAVAANDDVYFWVAN
jgi:hypothetical protein